MEFTIAAKGVEIRLWQIPLRTSYAILFCSISNRFHGRELSIPDPNPHRHETFICYIGIDLDMQAFEMFGIWSADG